MPSSGDRSPWSANEGVRSWGTHALSLCHAITPASWPRRPCPNSLHLARDPQCRGGGPRGHWDRPVLLYRPTTRQAWPGILTESYDWDVRVSSACDSSTALPHGSPSSPPSPQAWPSPSVGQRPPAVGRDLCSARGSQSPPLQRSSPDCSYRGTNWRSGPLRSVPTSGATESCSIPSFVSSS